MRSALILLSRESQPASAFACRAAGEIRNSAILFAKPILVPRFSPAFRENCFHGLDGPPGKRQSSSPGRTNSPYLAAKSKLLNAFWTLLGPCLGRLEGGRRSGGRCRHPQIASAAKAGEPLGQQTPLCSSPASRTERGWVFLGFFRVFLTS